MNSLTSPLSLCTTMLTTKFGETPLSTGSAFFYDVDGRVFMVTNRHNLTGRHQDTGQPLSDHGGVPNYVEFPVLSAVVDEATGTGHTKTHYCCLRWEIDDPPWREHPTLGAKADVVSIDLERFSSSAPKPMVSVNTLPDAQPIVAQPALSVSVIGYPFGTSVANHFPIWVGGTIASEPSMSVKGKPAFYIDCRTNKGSSGSPVFAYVMAGLVGLETADTKPKPAMVARMSDGRVAGMFGTPVHRFLGIYSGRINEASDIGIVWRTEVVDAVCRG